MTATHVIIPGVKSVWQRQDWEDPAVPVVGPSNPGVFADAVGHYPGGDDVPDGDYRGHIYVDPTTFENDLKGYYRQMQASYTNARGYSVGYGFGIDYLGGLTVLRGFDIRNAANAGSKLPGNWNHRSISAQFVFDVDQPATDLALYTFAMLVAYLRHEGHRANVSWHSLGEYTACPGPIRMQLLAGYGEPEHWVEVGPPPGAAPLPPYLTSPTEPEPWPPPRPPDEDEEDMKAIQAVYIPNANVASSGRTKWFVLLSTGDVRHASGPDASFALATGTPQATIEGVEHYDQCVLLDNVWRARGT